jgi:large subunit ribosomal protein L22
MVMKRFHARGRGKASTIEKWFSHISITVAEAQTEAAPAEQEAA